MQPKNPNRYIVPSDEDFEPGSNGQVLKNYLGITDKEKMDLIEGQELKRTQFEVIDLFDKPHRFTAKDICDIHRLWLGGIYPSAGNFRTVTMSKDGFPFASSQQIPYLMRKFETDYLSKYTPCNYQDIDELAYALGIVQVEFILIHPFREGNGRTARLLSNLMALQADKPLLDFSSIDQTVDEASFKKYIEAIHAGLIGNYKPIQDIFAKIISESI